MNKPNPPVPPELGRLSTLIDSHIECLAGTSSELRSIALCAAKHIFDWALETEKHSKPHLETLLSTLTNVAPPQTRSRARSAPTKSRSASPTQKLSKKINIRETPLPSLFIEGMNIDQIWQQLDLRAARVCENLQALQDKGGDETAILEGDHSDEDQGEDEDDAEEVDIDGDENVWEELSSGEGNDSSSTDSDADLREECSEDDEDLGSPTSVLRDAQKLKPSRSYSEGHSGLDDDFFNLADFNTETVEVEGKVLKRKRRIDTDEDFSDGSEVDLFGSVDDSDVGVDDDHGPALFYNDFFEPPPRTQGRRVSSTRVRFHERVSVKKIRLVGKGMPVSSICDEYSDEEEESDSNDDSIVHG